MARFKLNLFETYEQTWIDEYDVEANSIEEAIKLIHNEDVEPVDSYVDTIYRDPIRESIENDKGIVVFNSKDIITN